MTTYKANISNFSTCFLKPYLLNENIFERYVLKIHDMYCQSLVTSSELLPLIEWMVPIQILVTLDGLGQN